MMADVCINDSDDEDDEEDDEEIGNGGQMDIKA